ncbi:HPF/RaiA family ribosome-associated protein [Actinokineospora auranticolor]|uniref:Sigma 54 modulation/S30EA-like ribosomal protein n=1 Tax=Actinokineospora auranticolor TaxID=155976 RepID=A0A2S6GSZ3_9PSEU|nr:HPF/RaiA family ribosome-associated protein [Actinokineospora auranticolor]PPK68309.1 hypothetical protein CLV40_10532 [Actinokineospora auranticolor]
MDTDQLDPTPVTQVLVRGVAGDGIEDYALDKIESTLRRLGTPPRRVRVTVTVAADPAVAEPVTAHADVDHDHLSPVHVTAHAATPRAAVDRLRHTLIRRLSSA